MENISVVVCGTVGAEDHMHLLTLLRDYSSAASLVATI